MSQALYTSGTGLKAGTNQINVVSNNVANMNTTAYKSSRVNFETLFYSDLSHSSTASVTSGGVNAKQVGHGVQIGSITRNFTQGTFINTGRDQDMMISGNGYFVVTDSSGQSFLTRDGSFSLDSNGDLVTSSGYYVMGATSTYSTTSSDVNIHIPTLLNMDVHGTTAAEFGETLVSEMNNADITAGTFTMIINDNGGPQTVNITLAQDDIDTMDITALVGEINTQLQDAGADDKVTVTVTDGTITFAAADADTAIEFETPEEGGSNFVEELGLSNVEKTEGTDNYVTKVANYSAVVDEAGSYNASVTLEDWGVSNNGIIEATYSDGSKLTVAIDENNEMTWQITTSDFVKITGDDVTMDDGVLDYANMMLEMCMVVNESGLESDSNNLWTIGSNAGTPYFGVAGYAAFGTIQTGGLEASNVELSDELSEMILAQRLVQANSRVFNTASSTLETLVYLGQ